MGAVHVGAIPRGITSKVAPEKAESTIPRIVGEGSRRLNPPGCMALHLGRGHAAGGIASEVAVGLERGQAGLAAADLHARVGAGKRDAELEDLRLAHLP